MVIHSGVAAHLDHLAHRGVLRVRCGNVRLLPASHVESDERVAVYVGIYSYTHGLVRVQRGRATYDKHGGRNYDACQR